MDTCYFNDEQICAYDVVNGNFALNYQLDKKWKIAGKKGELICEDCGQELIFKVKDPRKKVPHFAHKNTNGRCWYSTESIKESQNHKMGKMMLYTYFKERYPDEKVRINHRFEGGRRADVFIHFKSGEKLAVEYQRSELDVREWEKKHHEYTQMGMNTLWFLRGNGEELKAKEKQIEVSFFQRVMLNENHKTALYLQVDKGNMIIAKNMRYTDPYDFSKDYEELFIREYNMDEVIIHPNGKIECGFMEEYQSAINTFIKEHDMEAMKDKNLRDMMGKKGQEMEQVQLSFFDMEEKKPAPKVTEPLSPKKEPIESDKVQEKREPKYMKDGISFQYKLRSALRGNDKGKKDIIKYFVFYAGSDDMKLLRFICEYNHHSGVESVLDIYRDIVLESGLGDGKLELQFSCTDDMICPMCGGELEKKYGRGGEYVTCENSPKCNLSFGIK